MMKSIVTALALASSAGAAALSEDEASQGDAGGLTPGAVMAEAIGPGPWAGELIAGAASAMAAAAAANAPSIEYAPPPYLEPLQTRLEEAATFDKTVGLAVAIIENGEPVLIHTSGETAAGSGEPVTAETAFRAASLTKSFTGVLLAVLEDEGLIDLDAPADPEIIKLKAPRQPTWLELVTHQTGLPPNAYDNLIEAGRGADMARARLAEVDLLCPLGECYTYQNVAFSSVEALVQAATGLSYEEALRTYVFEPLGLETAGVGEDDLIAAESWARPHRGWRRADDRPGSPRSHYDGLPSAAGVTLTLNDLIAWAQAHLDEGALEPDVRERVFTPYVRTLRETRGLGPVRARVRDTHYGLGWRVYEWGDRTLITHAGYLSGYGAQVVMEPETGFAFVALWNADARAPWRLWPTVMDLRTGDGPGDWIDLIKD